MNNICLVGRLTFPPDFKYTNNGDAVCTFSIAVQDPFNKERADFFSCQAWGKLGENLEKYKKKGDMIEVVGRVRVEKYEDKNGEKKTAYKVIASGIGYLPGSKKDDQDSNGLKEQPVKNSKVVEVKVNSEYSDVYDEFTPDELPF